MQRSVCATVLTRTLIWGDDCFKCVVKYGVEVVCMVPVSHEEVGIASGSLRVY